MLALYMSSFTSFFSEILRTSTTWMLSLTLYAHTVLLFLYIKKHYILENTSKCWDVTFRPWESHLFLFAEYTL